MSNGVIAETNELIALQRFVSHVPHKPNAFVQNRGTHLSRLRGRGMEFAEVRNYQAGDEIRHMEWRITARTGRAHVKVYEEEKEQAFVLLVDFSPSMFFGTRVAFKSVIAARLAALLAWTAIRQGDRIGALLFSKHRHKEFTPKSRDAGVLPLLAALSDYTKEFLPDAVDTTSLNGEKLDIKLSDELLRLRRVTKPGSKLVIISDFYQMDEDCFKHLTRLAAHNDLIAYHICDLLELAPPKPGLYPISNGREALLLDSERNNAKIAYQSWCDERLAHLKAQCQRLQMRYIPVRSEDSLISLVPLTGFRRSRG